MPVFEYKAVAPTGETVQGTMEAGNMDLVISRLQEAGNIPLQAREAGQGGLSLDLFRFSKRGMNAREIGQFTQQLSTLLGAGLPLDRSLQVLLELSENERVNRTVGDIRDRVREGGSLSEALEAQHGTFSRLFVNMVTAGEIGGTLDTTLERLSDYLERSKEMKDSVVSAMIYPGFLVTLAVATLIVLLVFVIPAFAPIFEDLGADLPFVTKVVMFVATALQKFWWGLIGICLFVILWTKKTLSDPMRRLSWDKRILEARWVGHMVAKIEAARISRTLGTLLINGVPLLSALSIALNVIGNTVLAQDVKDAAREVKTGGGLARNLAKGGHFPRLALQMISVGEETGKLDEMLLKVADTYDIESRNTINRMLSVFVPLVTVLMAIMVGVILMSVLLPMLSMNELVG
jgi:general secretion pathway protein F